MCSQSYVPSPHLPPTPLTIEQAEGLYICFPDSFWDKMEPPALRDADLATRAKRLATRLSPSFYLPEMKYIKAVYKPTGQMVGVAGWMLPGESSAKRCKVE